MLQHYIMFVFSYLFLVLLSLTDDSITRRQRWISFLLAPIFPVGILYLIGVLLKG